MISLAEHLPAFWASVGVHPRTPPVAGPWSAGVHGDLGKRSEDTHSKARTDTGGHGGPRSWRQKHGPGPRGLT